MFNWQALKGKIADSRAQLAQNVAKFRNQKFMEAAVAACALMAASDGTVSGVEKQKMAGFIRNSEELKVFDMAVVIPFFDKVVANFEFDAMIGKGEALKYIGRVKDSPEQAQLVVRLAMAIGSSDGNFDSDEQAMARSIAQHLGLDPAQFDL